MLMIKQLMLRMKANMKINWISRRSIPLYLLFLYVLFVLSIYIKQVPIKRLLEPSTVLVILLCPITLFSALIEISLIRAWIKKHTLVISAVVLLLSPMASFAVVEIMVSNYNTKMFLTYSPYNLVWYYGVYFLIYALTANSKWTVIIGNFLVYGASVLNYLVYLFRGNPIIPSDLLTWQTGMSVASHYDLSFTKGYLIATLIMLIVFCFAYKLERVATEISLMKRLTAAGLFLLFAGMVNYTFFETDFIQSKIKVIDFFAPKYTYCAYGTAFGFAANVEAMKTDPPKDYSVQSIETLLEKKVSESKMTDTVGEASVEDKPNIIVIMNEAFSDLSMIGDFKTNKDYLPYSSGLEENTTKGTLYTSVFGGATSDTEYEFLTGNSMAVMPSGSVPYQQFVTEATDSLAKTLKAQGYYNIAIHPYTPSGYKRDIVYPLLGFDEFLSEEDFMNPELIRSYISDRECYEKIIEEYEKKQEEGPIFVFNVTMQNHGGYSAASVFEEDRNVRFTELRGYLPTEQYLSLLRETDLALQSLINYFSAQEEKTILLLFGDHQPVAYARIHNELDQFDSVSDEAVARRYKVPFILWANYDIAEDDVKDISANYLSSYLLKTAGLEGTAYNQYLLELYEEIPVINALFYIDKNGELRSLQEKSEYSDLISEYRSIGYNNALDKENKLNKYYYVND